MTNLEKKLQERDKKLKEDIKKGKVKVCNLDNKNCENCGA